MSVFAWGCGRYGQLGNGLLDNQALPMKMDLSLLPSKDEEVPMHVVCGSHCTFMITSKQNVYACGMGRYGRLGVGSQKDHTFPVPVQLPGHILNLSSRFTHSSSVDNSGQLYCWGSTHALSYPIISPDSDTESKKEMGAGKASASMADILAPAIIDVPLLDGMDRAVVVACGHNFTLVVTESGMVFSWGNGKHGVLGHGNESNVARPTLVESIRGLRIVSAKCGANMSALLTEDGRLFTAGCSKEYALGHGPMSGPVKSFKPVETLFGEKIIDCSCSPGEHHRHMLACTETGTVYAWGDGNKGKLGNGTQNSLEWPIPIDQQHFLGQRVVKVVAGGLHSLALTEKGLVFSWGCGSDGRLGHKEAIGHRYLYKETIPRLVESLASMGQVTDIDCSYYHCAAILSTKL